ncbi:MAG: hypothetical protein V1754_07795, partial [Pseudomonadota bacterium]
MSCFKEWQLLPKAASLTLGLIFCALVLACPTRPLETAKPKVQQSTPQYYPQTLEKDVDLLFVIDNSGSMGEEQTNLKNNFPKLIEALRSDKLGNAPKSVKPCTEQDMSGCNIPNIHL